MYCHCLSVVFLIEIIMVFKCFCGHLMYSNISHHSFVHSFVRSIVRMFVVFKQNTRIIQQRLSHQRLFSARHHPYSGEDLFFDHFLHKHACTTDEWLAGRTDVGTLSLSLVAVLSNFKFFYFHSFIESV